jgi:phosphatidate cytidylyltransferase
MLKRVLTAVVLVPLVVALVLWAPPWLFFLGVLLVGWLCLWEYLELMGRIGSGAQRWPLYVVTIATWLVAAFSPGHLLAAVVAGGLLLFTAAVARRGAMEEIPWASAAGVFGLVYVGLPFALVLELRQGPQGALLLLYLLLLVWVGDTAAYFVGRGLGRHKLAPRLSPGKTIEGTVGSLVFSVGVGHWLFQLWFSGLGVNPIHSWVLPVAVNVAMQVGDLAESGLKRGAGAKDSSTLLPGHGGVLDRVDGLLFAAPVLWYYWNALI